MLPCWENWKIALTMQVPKVDTALHQSRYTNLSTLSTLHFFQKCTRGPPLTPNTRFSLRHIPLKYFFFHQCSKMQFITFQNFHIQTCFCQFLCFFSLKCWFKGQMMSRIHLSLPNVYKLMCFDRNINGTRDVKFLECDKWSLHWYKNLTLPQVSAYVNGRFLR